MLVRKVALNPTLYDEGKCFDVKLTLIFYKRIQIELTVPLLWLLCFLLFPICSLHTETEKERETYLAVVIRRLKFREILVIFSCVLHILL